MVDQARIELLDKLGAGSFGEVWIGRLFENGEEGERPRYIAVKIERNIPMIGTGLEEEFKAMKAIKKH